MRSAACIRHNSYRSSLPDERHAVGLRQIVFVIKCGHLFVAAPINHVHDFSPQSSCSSSDIDRGIAAPDYGDSRADLHMIEAVGLCPLNKRERIAASADLFRFDVQIFGFAESNTEEYRVVLAFEFCQR
ncbi:MAG: hypothetical protein DMG63_00560 [Acidobacteria bacterium]|nr:MAG: hypothetical protein DMG63_00560 [Acidobacteriota bacterium]